MQIIRQGVKPKKYPWLGRYLCASCRSVFELTEDDADKLRDWGENQIEGYWVKVDCPVCDEVRSLLQWEKTSDYTKDATRR